MKSIVWVDKIRSYQTLVYKNGQRTFKRKEYIQYTEQIKKQIDAWEYYTDDVEVRIDFYSHTKAIGDLDNITTPILDILQGTVLANDRQVVKLKLSKNFGVKDSSIEIKIEEAV